MKLWNVTLTTREIMILLKFIEFLGRLKMIGKFLPVSMGIEEEEIRVLREKLDRTPLPGKHIGEFPD